MAINFLKQMILKRIIKNIHNQNTNKITDPLNGAYNKLGRIPNLSSEEKEIMENMDNFNDQVGRENLKQLKDLHKKTHAKTITKDEIESIKTIQKSIKDSEAIVQSFVSKANAIIQKHAQSKNNNQEQENTQKEESKKEESKKEESKKEESKKEQSQKEEQNQKEEPTQTQEEKKNDTTQTRETEQKQQTTQDRETEQKQTQNESTNTSTYTPPQQDSKTETYNREKTQENPSRNEPLESTETIVVDKEYEQTVVDYNKERLNTAQSLLKLMNDPLLQADEKRKQAKKILDEMNEKHPEICMGEGFEDISYPEDASEISTDALQSLIEESFTNMNQAKRNMGQCLVHTTEDLELDLGAEPALDADLPKTFKDFKGKETKFASFYEKTNLAAIKFDKPITEKNNGKETNIAGVEVHVRKNGLISFANAPGNPNRELLSHPEVIAEIVKLYPDSFKTIPAEVFATNPKLFAEAFKTGTIKMAESGELGNTSIEQYYFDAKSDITQMCQRAMEKGTKEQNEAIVEVHDNSSVKLETNEEEIARADQELEEEIARADQELEEEMKREM